MSKIPGGVWRHPHFLKLWAGRATSMFGSLIGGLAYSLVAILTVHATPAEIAVLNACNLVPGLIAGPWVGVWADRVRHRPLLIAADIGRALSLATIPLAALAGSLTIVQLYLVATVAGVLTMLFDVSFRSYIPVLLGREELIQGNMALKGTDAVTEAGGFATAGILVQIFTAPIAIAFDAVSFLLSALSLAAIRHAPDGRPAAQSHERRRSWHEVAEGARTVWHDPVMRALTATACAAEIAGQPIGVVIMLFFVHDLHLTPGEMGPLFGIGGVSAFVGAVVCTRVLRRFGTGPAMIGAMYVDSFGLLAVLLAGGPVWLVLFFVGLGQLADGGRAIYEIVGTTLLQMRAPEGVMARVFATYETLRSAAMLIGMLLGGILGEAIGLRPVLILALAANMLVPLCLLFSPVRRMRDIADEASSPSLAQSNVRVSA